MIERKFILENLKEYKVKEYIRDQLKKAGISSVKLQKTPLGEKITVATSRPGLIVGRKGQNIRVLTQDLKDKFRFENPQIDIQEVENVNLDPHIIADKIANSLERFGPARFKAIGHKTLESVMQSGARGVEIMISGKIPSARSRTWRFYSGYMKKSGEFNKKGVLIAYAVAKLKTGVIGIKVRIMPPKVELPDSLSIKSEEMIAAEAAAASAPAPAEESAGGTSPKEAEKKPAKAAKKATAKPAAAKPAAKKSDKKPAKKPADEQAAAEPASVVKEA